MIDHASPIPHQRMQARKPSLRRFPLLALLLLAAFAGTTSAWGASYSVAPTGNDTNDGSASSPFATIQRACGVVQAGDTVFVEDGTYHVGSTGNTSGDILISRSGTASARITFVARHRWQAKLVGHGTAAGSAVIALSGGYITIKDFDITGTDANGIEMAKSGYVASYNVVDGNYIHDMVTPCNSDSGAGITSDGAENYQIVGHHTVIGNLIVNLIADDGCPGGHQASGIAMMLPYGTVANNIVINCGDAIEAWHAAHDTIFFGNVIIDSLRGLSMGAGDAPGGVINDNSIVQNNIVINGSGPAIIETGGTGTHNVYRDNLVFGGDTSIQLSNGLQATGTIRQDPRFVNNTGSASGDYHLRPDSPAIGTGLALAGIPVDFDGIARPQTGATDIGAYLARTPTAVSASLAAAPPAITNGQASVLSWSTTNAVAATLNGAAVGLTGSQTVAPTATTTYQLVATDATGATASSSATITVSPTTSDAPTAGIAASAMSIAPGQSTVLTWTTTNAASADLNGTTVALNGSQTVAPSATTTYRITAHSASGATDWGQVTIIVSGTAPNHPPTVALTAPGSGTSFSAPASVAISADAADSDGSIARVEFYQGSVLLGIATTAPYGLTWSGVAAGTYALTAKAYDDLGAVTTTSAVTITVVGATAPSVSLWSGTATPAVAAAADPGACELGVKFRSDVSGVVTGLRFYKGVGNGGTHTGHLWSVAGALLGSVTFADETSSGWQLASFDPPVALAAGTTYVASYFAPLGHYAYDLGFFTSAGVDRAPLHALADGVDGGNGVYAYGSASVFPTKTYSGSNYWVDVVFRATGSTPYGGVARSIPGTIEAEDFDDGGEGIAYHDDTAGNAGGAYRQTSVDVYADGNAGNGNAVGWIDVGEWLAYTVDVASTGSYDLSARVALPGGGGSFHVEIDGADLSGALGVPDTGGWTSYTTLTRTGVPLTAGQHVLRVAFDGAGANGVCNLDWIAFAASAAPPPAWTDADVGGVGHAGSASDSNGTWTVRGSGDDIWNQADAFHYVSQALSGDGQIIARVASQTDTDPWAKAGVMIRESTTAGSRHAMMVTTPGNGTAFQRRVTTDGSSSHTAGSWSPAPCWVRLDRQGDTLTGYESSDGAAWTVVGSATVQMGANVLIGLAVTAHDNAAISTAVFDHVSIVAGPVGGG